MADLVDQRLADRRDEVVLVLGVALVRALKEQDAVGQRVAVAPARARSAACPGTGRTACRAARSPSRASSSRDGSSSTTIAMFCIALREAAAESSASASATRRSNSSRVIDPPRFSARVGFGRRLAGARSARRRGGSSRSRRCTDALVAERLRPADAPAVQDQRVGGARPASRAAARRTAAASTTIGIVGLGDADAVRHAQHVAIDRQPGHAERVAEHDVRRLAADARQRGQRVHVGRHLAAVLARRAPAPCR